MHTMYMYKVNVYIYMNGQEEEYMVYIAPNWMAIGIHLESSKPDTQNWYTSTATEILKTIHFLQFMKHILKSGSHTHTCIHARVKQQI